MTSSSLSEIKRSQRASAKADAVSAWEIQSVEKERHDVGYYHTFEVRVNAQ